MQLQVFLILILSPTTKQKKLAKVQSGRINNEFIRNMAAAVYFEDSERSPLCSVLYILINGCL